MLRPRSSNLVNTFTVNVENGTFSYNKLPFVRNNSTSSGPNGIFENLEPLFAFFGGIFTVISFQLSRHKEQIAADEAAVKSTQYVKAEVLRELKADAIAEDLQNESVKVEIEPHTVRKQSNSWFEQFRSTSSKSSGSSRKDALNGFEFGNGSLTHSFLEFPRDPNLILATVLLVFFIALTSIYKD